MPWLNQGLWEASSAWGRGRARTPLPPAGWRVLGGVCGRSQVPGEPAGAWGLALDLVIVFHGHEKRLLIVKRNKNVSQGLFWEKLQYS